MRARVRARGNPREFKSGGWRCSSRGHPLAGVLLPDGAFSFFRRPPCSRRNRSEPPQHHVEQRAKLHEVTHEAFSTQEVEIAHFHFSFRDYYPICDCYSLLFLSLLVQLQQRTDKRFSRSGSARPPLGAFRKKCWYLRTAYGSRAATRRLLTVAAACMMQQM